MKRIFTLFTLAALTLSFSNAGAQCGTPVNLQSSYSNNVSTFTWDPVPGATAYIFELDWEGGTWGFGSMPATTNSYSINGLMQGGRFQWHVSADCGGTPGAFSATALFETPCAQPINLSTTNIALNSATLNWANTSPLNTNNTGFSVSYKPASSTTWIQLTNIYNNITATTFNLTGLMPGTTYDWRVRRVCSSSNSNYLTSSFTTTGCLSAGYNASEWINRFSVGTINRLSGKETGGYIGTNLSTNLVIGSSNAGQISAGFFSMVRNQRFNVYIDLNRNGSFNDPGEAMLSGNNNTTISGTNIKNFTLTIPSTSTTGVCAMRVVMVRSNQVPVAPCLNNHLGETEDYYVNLVASGNKMGEVAKTVIATDKPVASAITASPNPSSGLFHITTLSGEDIISYEVTDMQGKTIIRKNISPSNRTVVDLSGGSKGLYLLRVTDKNQKTEMMKLIVQ
ncbi:MAG: GEVED domain-containing protein [Bacteroidetes bacterium]|nr:GEVED domain-containing protein [Bacteroidota bacterium]